MKIPSEFKLFGTTYKVKFDNDAMAKESTLGQCDYNKCEITLSTQDKTIDLSQDVIMNTFYHERTHAILDAMDERELSSNEKFVDVLSKLLRQSDETAIFDIVIPTGNKSKSQTI